MSVIKIAVACHKPSKLPNNALFMPVQVNSINASKRMNMAHDDEGDNISYKNPNYCELTAQYWEWKNVEADYYGLCHYRRFLCFHVPQDAKRNARNHIEAEAIDDINLKRFGLENEDEMRSVIEQNDVIVGEYEKISKLFTPRGNQLTAYKHWTAHDRALIRTKDLERMLELLDQVAPEVGADAREFLNKDQFTGFNCFVLRKDLFNELCKIEFKVLELLEKDVDLTYYCTQLSRIYGFMGEIISSSYIYHLEKSGHYRVKHVPLLYFNYTDEPVALKPVENAIPVVFCYDHYRPALFGVIWESFLNHMNGSVKYDVIIAWKYADKDTKNAISKMAADYENIKVRFLDTNLEAKKINEHYKPKRTDGKELLGWMPILPFLPYVLNEYSAALVFTKDILFCDAPDELWREELDDSKVLGCALDSLMLARVNDIYPETEYNYLKKQVKNPYEFFSIASMKMNMEAYRKSYTQYEIAKKCWNNEYQLRNDEEVINVLFEGRIQKMNQKWNTWFESNGYLKYQLPYMPLNNQKEQTEARKHPAVISYQPDDPWGMETNIVTQLFWSVSRETPFYELYLGYRTEFQNQSKKRNLHITEKVFPKGSAIHGVASRVLPKDSRRYKAIKKTLSVFHME